MPQPAQQGLKSKESFGKDKKGEKAYYQGLNQQQKRAYQKQNRQKGPVKAKPPKAPTVPVGPPGSAPKPPMQPGIPSPNPVPMPGPVLNDAYYPQFAPAPPGPRMPGDFDDPMNSYLATIPIMELERDRNIGGAMAAAGFTGNRYSSSAMESAGQIGAETALKQNQMLNQLLFDESQGQQNRAAQMVPHMLNAGQMTEDAAQNRLNQMGRYGMYEQGRTDDYARLAYEDYERNKLGYLPYLLDAASSQGAGTPGSGRTPYQFMTDPGRPPKISPEMAGGFVDILTKFF